MSARRALEHPAREFDGRLYEFLLNPGERAAEVISPFAGENILTGRVVAAGETLTLAPADVVVLETR
jgi:beta-galactosidase